VPFPSFDFILLWMSAVVFQSFLGAGSPLFSWLFPCWCRPKALSPGVSSPPILSAEQRLHAPKFQFFPLVISSLGSARSLSDRVGSLSDRHLAQPDLYPIVSGLCLIITWLSQTSVRSSLGSAWSLSDRAGSLSDCHFTLPLYSCDVSLARFIL
jgi:hypothetical protein